MNLYHFACICCTHAIFNGSIFEGCASGTTEPHVMCKFELDKECEANPDSEGEEKI